MKRFWDKVAREGTCEVWTGARNKAGYGVFRALCERRNILAHRMRLILEYCPDPGPFVVCHSCNNPACVKKEHLRVDTQRANLAEMRAAGRGKQPGLKGENHPRARFTDEHVSIIRQLSRRWGAARIARIFHARTSTIANILKGRTR